MNRNLFHSGQDNQPICVQLLCEDGGGEILVNDGGCALQMVPFRFEHRDAAPAAGNDDMICLHEGADRIDFDDTLWFRAGHHPAPAAAGIFHDVVIPFLFQCTGFRLGHEGADGFGGILEGRIVRIHFHLGQHGSSAFIDAPVQHFFAHGVLEVIADIALAHSHTDRQGARNILFRLGTGQLRHGVLDHAHLGTVAMADDDFVAVLDQVHHGLRRNFHGFHLLRQIGAQGVSAQGNHDSFAHK